MASVPTIIVGLLGVLPPTGRVSQSNEVRVGASTGAIDQGFRGTLSRTSAAWYSSSIHRWYFGWSGYFLRR